MKTGLITGATSGIGKATAELWLQRSTCPDDRLFVGYGHNAQAADEFVRTCPCPEKAIPIRADLSCEEGVDAVARAVAQSGRTLDDVVLNVGIGLYKKIGDLQLEEWEHVLRTNLTMPIFLLQALLPHITRETGSVVLIGSYAGEMPFSTSLAYGVSKAGLLFAARALVKDLEPYGIRINGIAPGFTETPWHTHRSDESYARINAKVALHRFGEPDEIAKAILDTMENTFMNGSIIDIHGGYNYF